MLASLHGIYIFLTGIEKCWLEKTPRSVSREAINTCIAVGVGRSFQAQSLALRGWFSAGKIVVCCGEKEGFSSQVLQQNISCSPTCPFWNKHKNWTCKSCYMNIIEFTEFLSENTCLQNKITFHIYLQINLVFIEWIWYLQAPARIFERFILIQLIICCYSLIIFCVLWLGTQSGCSLRLTELI